MTRAYLVQFFDERGAYEYVNIGIANSYEQALSIKTKFRDFSKNHDAGPNYFDEDNYRIEEFTVGDTYNTIGAVIS